MPFPRFMCTTFSPTGKNHIGSTKLSPLLLEDVVDDGDGEEDRGGMFLVFVCCLGGGDEEGRGGVISEGDDKLDRNCSTRSTLGL